jgi:hypothetical protein
VIILGYDEKPMPITVIDSWPNALKVMASSNDWDADIIKLRLEKIKITLLLF